MKIFASRWLLSILAILMLGRSIAVGAVEMTVLPVFDGHIVSDPVPLLVKLRNVGPRVKGAMVVGPQSRTVEVPFSLGANELRTAIVYCPLGFDFPSGAARDASIQPQGCIASVSLVTEPRQEPTAQVLKLRLPSTTNLLVTTDRTGFDRLKLALTSLKSDLSVISPQRLPERVVTVTSLPTIVLGSGTAALTDLQVAMLQQYLIQGGTLILSPSRDSARYDSRWAKFEARRPASGPVGLGRIFCPSEDVENPHLVVDSHHPDAPGKYKGWAGMKTAWADNMRVGPLVNANPVSPGSTGLQPAQIHMPSVLTLAGALFAYFIVVIPLNILVLRKLQRPEWMWITSPLVSVAFAAMIFRTTSDLRKIPPSVSTMSGYVSVPEVDSAYARNLFGIFSPDAASMGFNLSDAQNLTAMSSRDQAREGFGAELRIVDRGSWDVPQFRFSSLAYKEFSDLELPHTQPIVQFSVAAPKEGVSAVVATNVSGKTIDDVSFVAGEYLAESPRLLPGTSIKIMAEHVERASPSLADGNGTNAAEYRGMIASARTRGQVAVFGTIKGLPVGPRPSNQVRITTCANFVAFAPLNLKLP